MAVAPRLLLVGNDLILLRAWKMILDVQFKVTVSARFSEAVREIEKAELDLLVICSDPETWKLTADLASYCNASLKIIVVTSMGDAPPLWVDASVCSLQGPYELLKLCAGFFGLASTMRGHGFSMGGTGTYIPKGKRRKSTKSMSYEKQNWNSERTKQ